MNKKTIKPILMSALSALAFGSVGAAGTFALFTDKAETTVSVQAGKVDVDETASLVRYQSTVDGSDVDLIGKTSHTNTLVGSSFSLTGSTINIQKMVPGDKLTLKLTSKNKSNVKTKTRYALYHSQIGSKDLFPALKVSFSPATGTVADLFKWTARDAAENQTDGDDIYSVDVTIEFVEHNEGILANNQGIDNAYMNAGCSIGFALETVQGNAQTNIIDEINNYLRAEMVFEGKNPTMHDAVVDMAEIGYTDLDVLEGYVYSLAADQFVAESNSLENKENYFKVGTSVLTDYSTYAAPTWNLATVPLSGTGFDAGDASGIEQVNYIRTGVSDEKDVLIRTNSLDTSVTINAPNDVVTHYGDAKQVSIVAVKGSSYHEYGRVLFVDVSTGRIALEATSEVERVHFNVQDDRKTFENIVVAYDESLNALPEFSRDAVSEIKSGGTLVVELQKGTEVTEQTEKDYVYLYQQGLKEQIRVTSQENASAEQVAQAPVSTDASVAPKTKTAAEQISNSLTGGSYTAEQIAKGEVDADDVTDNGIDAETAEEKQEIIQSIIEDRLTEIAVESSTTEHRYVARIGSQFFESFYDAFYAVNGNGKTIRVISNEADEEFVRGFNYKFYLNNGTEPVRDEENKYISLPYNDLTIHVETGVTLDLGEAKNNRIIFNGTSGSLRLEGAGSYAFDGDSQNSLVGITNPLESIRVYTADATFTSRDAKGYLANGKWNIASGTYINIGFSTTPEAIKGGAFSNTDFENYLPDGKMAVLSGDYYVIGNLTAAGAKFRVDNPEMESLYYRTLDYKVGAFSSAQAGATITFLDDYHQEGAIGHLKNNITIDLNSHTLDTLTANPALPITDGNSITVRNGYLDVLKVVEEGMTSYTLVGDNLRVNDSNDENHTHIYSEEFLARVNGAIVKDAEATATIQTAAPQEYAAKIVRGTREFYFVGEHGVKYAMSKIMSGDTVYVNQYEEDAVGSLGQLEETLTIYKDSNVEDFPKVTSSTGKATPTIAGDRCDFVVEQAPVCKVTIGTVVHNYMSLQAAVSDTTNSKNHTIEILEDFNIASKVEIPAYAGTLTIDFCGHTVTVLGSANGHGGLATNQRVFNVTAHNNKYDQDIYFKNTTTETTDLKNSGGIILEEANLIQNSKKNNSANMDVYIEGGVFRRQSLEGYVNQFIYNYYDNNIHITGGFFREDLFSHSPYSSLNKTDNPVFNVDGSGYYQVL